MSTAERYIAAAYLVVLVALLAYVCIITLKVARLDRETKDLMEQVRGRTVQSEHRKKVPVG